MRKLLVFTSMLFFTIILIGCEEQINEGTVLDSNFIPTHWVHDTCYNPGICISDKEGNKSCKAGIWMDCSFQAPDRWYLQIEYLSGEHDGLRSRWIQVSRSCYENHSIGERWVRDEE